MVKPGRGCWPHRMMRQIGVSEMGERRMGTPIGADPDLWAQVKATLPAELVRDRSIAVMTRHGPLLAIDTAIAPLVTALNSVPGVRTTSSCSGHEALEASLLFRADDDDNDALMASAFLRGLAAGRTADGEHAHSRWVTRRLSQYPNAQASWDDFEVNFWGRGSTAKEAIAAWYAERDAIIVLCALYTREE